MHKKEDLSKIWRPITSRDANAGSYSGEYHNLTRTRINELQTRIQSVCGGWGWGAGLKGGLRRYFLGICTVLFNVVNVHTHIKLKQKHRLDNFFSFLYFCFRLVSLFGYFLKIQGYNPPCILENGLTKGYITNITYSISQM